MEVKTESRPIIREIENTELNIYEKRFHLMMKLMRIDRMLKNAKKTHVEMP